MDAAQKRLEQIDTMQNFDFQKFAITPQGSAQITCPRARIEGQLVQDGAVVADFTGANSLMFPNVLATLTQAQASQVVDMVAVYVLACKAGLDT